VKPPSELGGDQVLRFALIDQEVRATEATAHRSAEIVNGEVVPGETMGEFAALAIVGGSHSGYFLLYLDGEGDSVADTWHETIEDALEQAEFEYEGITAKWVVP